MNPLRPFVQQSRSGTERIIVVDGFPGLQAARDGRLHRIGTGR